MRCALIALLVAAATPAMAAEDDLPVVAIHREIGLAAEGQFTNYKENFSREIAPGLHDREVGGAPGFAAKAETMFDLFGIRHLYASAVFRYDRGTTTYNGAKMRTNTPVIGTNGLETRETAVELGKGVLLGQRLLLTPALRYAFRQYDRDLGGYQEQYRHSMLGPVLHADYALTRRLVVSAQLGWAETLGPSMTASGQSVRHNGRLYPLDPIRFALGERPVWRAGASIDERVWRGLHLYGALDFQRFGYAQGRTVATAQGHSVGTYTEPDSWTQTVVLTSGLAWSY